MVKPALAGALVILLAYIGQYLILSLKKYIADRIIEAQTKQFIIMIKPNRKLSKDNKFGAPNVEREQGSMSMGETVQYSNQLISNWARARRYKYKRGPVGIKERARRHKTKQRARGLN